MNRWRRLMAIGVATVIGATACGPTIDPLPTPPPFAVPSVAAPSAPDGGSAQPLPTSPGESSPAALTTLPSDIVAAVDAVANAATEVERVEATAALLADIGVSVSAEERATPAGAAGIVLSPEEVEIIAASAARQQYRATLAEFAQAFGGMAFLPPNDALAADLPDGWLETDEPATDPGLVDRAALDLGPLANHVAAAVSAWVTDAIALRGSADSELVSLTTAPLILAELARRQANPVDLAQPFAAEDLRIGWLEITVLAAGMRSMLSAADAAGIGVAAGSASIVLAGRARPTQGGPAPVGQATPCNTLKQMIDSRVPLVSTHIGSFVGDQIKGFIQNFVNALFGEASTFAQGVGQAFTVLGLLFRVQALIMIYSEARAEVTMDAAFYHKPDGRIRTEHANLKVGIPDAAWEAAKQARQLSPFATALRVCARFLGLPVWQDLVDVGDALADWKVQWKLTRGGGTHAQIPGGAQFASGRFERPLTKDSDHTAVDAIDYDALPERREDHPGVERTDTVEWCAEVYPKAPPSGFGTILSASGAGSALAGGGYLGLVAVVANLLTSWVSTIASLDPACGQATVSFHVPLAGTWRGTITAATTIRSSESGMQRDSQGGVVTWTGRTSIDLTDRIYVGGNEAAPGSPFLMLEARQYTDGIALDEFNSNGVNQSGGCLHDFVNTQSSFGSWGFNADATVQVLLSPDGSYLLSWAGAQAPEEVVIPGEEVNAVTITIPDEHCTDVGSGTFDRPFFPGSGNGSSGHTQVQGQLDPANPGNVLRGSASFGDDRGTTEITWELVRDGPIRLP